MTAPQSSQTNPKHHLIRGGLSNFCRQARLFSMLVLVVVTSLSSTVHAAPPPPANTIPGADARAIHGSWVNWDPATVGCSTAGASGTVIPTDETQADIAKIIMGIAKTDGLGKNGALIGIMVALAESGLKIYANSNVPISLSNPAKQAVGSDHDSVGVFQQRPSTGWSTIATGTAALTNKDAVWQLMDPAYSAEAFFGSPPGSDAPPALSKGLMNQPGWEKMAPWTAAQAVQASGTPDGSNYRVKLPTAQALIDKYWDSATPVPLPVPITGGTAPGGASSSGTGCDSSATGELGAGTGDFTDNPSITYPGVDVMLARAKAITNPNSALFRQFCAVNSTNCLGLCDHIAGVLWGYSSSGYATAAVHWAAMQASGHAHPGDRNPPIGALLFYSTGHAAGHVAIYLGNNLVVSNDVGDSKSGRTGGMYIVSASELETGAWHLTYLGWSDPIFAGGKL